LHNVAGTAFTCATLSPVEPPQTDRTRPGGKRVIVVMPAYNAAKTLERTYADIPHAVVDQIILVDDVSHDETVDVARSLGWM
jgi:cellulose synthase/poly-beta-1,6-N-acetylglucosamine synthase-like glycosyltransferase